MERVNGSGAEWKRKEETSVAYFDEVKLILMLSLADCITNTCGCTDIRTERNGTNFKFMHTRASTVNDLDNKPYTLMT